MTTDHAFPFSDVDPSKLRLEVANGRQVWTYQDIPSRKQTICEKYWLGTLNAAEVTPVFESPQNAREAAINGMNFFCQLQTEDGHWAGEYGGPMFLLPGCVIGCYVTNNPLKEYQRVEIIRYLRNTQRESGGWGLHIEDDSTILGTATNYVVLRLLGLPMDDPACERARKFLKENGGAIGVPSWGKFWLAVLNVYQWEGLNPLLPELWVLPSVLPFHPSRIWCHARQIYLPMSYCYSHKIQAEENDLIRSLRQELFVEDYDSIDWVAARNTVSPLDSYAPHNWLLDTANSVMSLYQSVPNSALRSYALKIVLDHIRAEDLNTNYIGIGPISKMINLVVMHHAEGPESSSVRDHVYRIDDYLWAGPDGIRMQGTNGSQLWDTSLAVYGFYEAGLLDYPLFHSHMKKALEFLDDAQIKQNTPDLLEYYRQPSKGAFPFSTRDCGWIVSDCTAEGIKAVLKLQNLPNLPKLVSDVRLFEGVDVLINMQNADGGYASYESCRGPAWLERLNPSEVFGEIMIDYSYTECSSAVVQALCTFREHFPDHRKADIDRVVGRAIEFIKGQQGEDGSWFGSWGVCFTYGSWFALEGLAKVGENYENSEVVQKGCDFLVSMQEQDGGWGESYKACFEKVYVRNETSQVVNTAWALLGLMAAGYPDLDILKCGIKFLMERLRQNGEWKQESIEGVFNKTCMISYPNYKFIFTVWALGKFAKKYETVKA